MPGPALASRFLFFAFPLPRDVPAADGGVPAIYPKVPGYAKLLPLPQFLHVS